MKTYLDVLVVEDNPKPHLKRARLLVGNREDIKFFAKQPETLAVFGMVCDIDGETIPYDFKQFEKIYGEFMSGKLVFPGIETC